jgi:hypothetical protein
MDDNPYQSPKAEHNKVRYGSWRHAARRGAIVGAFTMAVLFVVLVLPLIAIRWTIEPHMWWITILGTSACVLVAITIAAIAGAGFGTLLFWLRGPQDKSLV